MPAGLSVLVAGGGIGGLVTAIGLRRIGAEVRVVERSPEPGAAGAGIALFPNAMRAFDALGVGDAVRSVAGRPLSASGEGGLRLPWGRWLLRTRHWDEQQLVSCHRNDLHAALLDAVPAGVVEGGTELMDVVHRAGGVDVRLRSSHGEEIASVGVLVAADGVHSTVRSRLWPPSAGSPRYAGYTAWRGVTSRGNWRTHGGETWGCGTRFGLVPIPGHRVYWFATANLPPDSGAGLTPRQRYAEVLSRFGQWHDPIPELLAATDPDDVLQHDIAPLEPPLTTYVQRRVALLGDAAHAMTPDLGQGACQAIEDAAVLSAELAVADSAIEEALVRYAIRRLRTLRVARTAARIGRFAQLDGRLSTTARSAAMRLLLIGFGGAELEAPGLGLVEIVDVKVEVVALGSRLSRPVRGLVPLDEAEPD